MADAKSEAMEEFLLKFHGEELAKLLKSKTSAKRCVQINLTTLATENDELFRKLCRTFDEENEKWKQALMKVVTSVIEREQLKENKDNAAIALKYFQHPVLCWPRIENEQIWHRKS
jgi:hypothetical protein